MCDDKSYFFSLCEFQILILKFSSNKWAGFQNLLKIAVNIYLFGWFITVNLFRFHFQAYVEEFGDRKLRFRAIDFTQYC